MKYSEKLRDPRWQKKRLEIFNRDDWTCQKCGSKKDELHAHHKKYINGFDPWDYPSESLITYCYKCHRWTHFPGIKLDKDYVEKVRKRVYMELKDELNLPPYEELWKHLNQ